MVEWINPLNVPRKRRLQTWSVLLFVLLIPAMLFSHFLGFCLLLNPLTLVPMVGYYMWIWKFDKSHYSGTRKPWARDLSVYKHMRDYFPMSLVKTKDWSPDRKYVACYHPHGVISLGAMVNFATNATGFNAKFPGIDMHLLTLEMNFKAPFLREWLLAHGICSASKKSCDTILQRGSGSAIMLVVGGAAEALDAHKGHYELLLSRKGFVRVAIQNQADLVPVLGFGEVDVFDLAENPHGSWMRWIQTRFQSSLGFTMPFYHGRGCLNYSFGLLPYRTPITAVVGAPIRVPKWTGKEKDLHKGEGKALVDRTHAQYVNEVKALWNEHRKKYVQDPDSATFIVREK